MVPLFSDIPVGPEYSFYDAHCEKYEHIDLSELLYLAHVLEDFFSIKNPTKKNSSGTSIHW